MLTESYLARFERNCGIKKGTVSNNNPLFESFVADTAEEGGGYNFYLALDGKIIGGSSTKEGAIAQQEDYLGNNVRPSVFTAGYLQEKGIDVNDDSNWGHPSDFQGGAAVAGGETDETASDETGSDESMPSMDSEEKPEVEEGAAPPEPSQDDINAVQASEYEGSGEEENDKDAESQDDLHLGEDGYGTRPSIAKAQNDNASFRRNELPKAKPHEKGIAMHVAKGSVDGSRVERQRQLDKQQLPEEKEEFKLNESQYNRFLRNAGLLK